MITISGNELLNPATYEVSSDIASLILLRRKRIGLSQRVLAELAGVGEATVQRIEMGLVTPRPHTALVLEETLVQEEYRHRRLTEYYERILNKREIKPTL